jgi:hypothetical protein
MSGTGWDKCLERYQQLKQRPQWEALAEAMIALIQRIREDRGFPATTQIVSHAWLRIGPEVSDPGYRPTVWVGWRRPHYYWIGIGSFGTQNRVTVSAEKAVPMLKRYLANLKEIDPTFSRFVEEAVVVNTDPVEVDPWSSDLLAEKYSGLLKDDIVERFTTDLTTQVDDIRTLAEQIHEAIAGLEEVEGAHEAACGILLRLERITRILEQGTARYRDTPIPEVVFSRNGHHQLNDEAVDESK